MNNNPNVTNNNLNNLNYNNNNPTSNEQSNNLVNNINMVPPTNQNINNNSLSNNNVMPTIGITSAIPNNSQALNNNTINNQVTLGVVNNTSVVDMNNQAINNQPQTVPNNIDNSTNNQSPNIEASYLNDLNVNGAYNKMDAPEYVNNPKVTENINAPKKNTITVSKELKTVIIIAIVLLVFIFVMPGIFDLLNNIRFR